MMENVSLETKQRAEEFVKAYENGQELDTEGRRRGGEIFRNMIRELNESTLRSKDAEELFIFLNMEKKGDYLSREFLDKYTAFKNKYPPNERMRKLIDDIIAILERNNG